LCFLLRKLNYAAANSEYFYRGSLTKGHGVQTV
jgi:hypothetical protein